LGTAIGNSSVGTDHFSGVNAVMGSMFVDHLSGSGNNETFMGLAGDDIIDGRGGFDIAQYNNMTYTTGGISVDLAHGIVTGDASNGTDTLRSIEGIQGTNFADTFVATGSGLAGAPKVDNNGAFNSFQGQGGDDTIIGNGNTQILYGNATSGVTVDLQSGSAVGDASVGHDTITGGVNAVFGSNFADTLYGNGFGVLAGQGGN